MPVMDGYTASKAIREVEEETGVAKSSIIAISAHNAEAHTKLAQSS